MKDPKCECPIYYEHTCPYAEDVHGDSITLCQCCAHCENACAMDV